MERGQPMKELTQPKSQLGGVKQVFIKLCTFYIKYAFIFWGFCSLVLSVQGTQQINPGCGPLTDGDLDMGHTVMAHFALGLSL